MSEGFGKEEEEEEEGEKEEGEKEEKEKEEEEKKRKKKELVIQGSHMVSDTRCPAWSDS